MIHEIVKEQIIELKSAILVAFRLIGQTILMRIISE